MIQFQRSENKVLESGRPALQLSHWSQASHLFQSDREMQRAHLINESALDTRAMTMRTQNANVIPRRIAGSKKWQPLDVIPVRVREKQSRFHRLRSRLAQQVLAEKAKAAPGVENQNLIAGPHFHAGSVSSVSHVR
jgi:hypothetical protein